MTRRTDLNSTQIEQSVFDPATDAFKVEPISGTLVTEEWDYLAVTYPLATQEVYMFYNGGVSGVLVATVTVNYTDSTKNNLLNVART
jgi:hypothetical protein